MIDRAALLSDLQSLLQRLEADLLQRSESAEVPEVGRRLHEEYERAKKAERTAQNYEDWRSDTITQAAAAWVLSCVFVRFLEDNRLIDPPKIAGPGKRLQQARDEWELYLGKARQPNERDYLLSVFDELARLPGTKEVFGPHNPIRELPNWLSGDGARDMLGFFQKIDANSAESNKLIHDFTDPAWETRFLGDLYQDLSEAARKKYALLQTPEFVEEFILDRYAGTRLERVRPGGEDHQDCTAGVAGRQPGGAGAALRSLPHDRPGVRQWALPAGQLPPDIGPLAAERTGGQYPRTGAADARQHPRRGHQPLCRGHRPVPAAIGGHEGLRCDPAGRRPGVPLQPGVWRLAAARTA